MRLFLDTLYFNLKIFPSLADLLWLRQEPKESRCRACVRPFVRASLKG